MCTAQAPVFVNPGWTYNYTFPADYSYVIAMAWSNNRDAISFNYVGDGTVMLSTTAIPSMIIKEISDVKANDKLTITGSGHTSQIYYFYVE